MKESNIFGTSRNRKSLQDNLLEVVIELSKLSNRLAFKGGIINLNLISEKGFNYWRMTKDIDANSNLYCYELMHLLKQASEKVYGCECVVSLIRDMEKTFRFDVEAKNKSSDEFKVDINKLNFDLNRISVVELKNNKIIIQDPVISLVDKLSVVMSDKVCRRVKDLTDLYAMLNVDLGFTRGEIINELNSRNITPTAHILIDKSNDDTKQGLNYAYQSFKASTELPDLCTMVNTIIVFIEELVSTETSVDKWDSSLLRWR